MTSYRVMTREFNTLEEAIEYANKIDAFEIAIIVNDKVVSTHEL